MTLRRKLIWISVLYFAEGLPLGIVLSVLPVYFRQNGVSLTEIGFMSFLSLPWAIKVLWAPLVDRFGQRRTWVTLCCAAMACAIAAVPLFDAARPEMLLWLVLLAFTLASATQDIAIDAYTIGLVSKGEEGPVNGVRVAWYRVALMAGGGGTMWLVKPLGWTWVFLLLALAFIALAFVAWATPPVTVVHQPAREWARQFGAFLSRPGSIAVFAFILTYKLGDFLIGPMIKPFWVDQGMSPEEIGTISTIVGALLSIAGALAGGVFIKRYGIFHGLWFLGLVHTAQNLAYAAVAQFALGRPYLYSASVLESFTGGLGTAAFLAFLMRICDKDQAATQYALLSALFGLTRFLGGASGYGVEHLGYAGFFTLTFFLALPSYLLLPWVRRWIGNGEGQGQGVGAKARGVTEQNYDDAGEERTGSRRATPASAPAR